MAAKCVLVLANKPKWTTTAQTQTDGRSVGITGCVRVRVRVHAKGTLGRADASNRDKRRHSS